MSTIFYLSLPFNIALDVVTYTVRQKRKIVKKIGKKQKQNSLDNDMTVYVENPKLSTDNLIKP